MNVLVINSLYHPYAIGGAERSVKILSEALVEEGAMVTVLSLQPDAGTSETVFNGVRNVTIGLRNHYWPYDGLERSSIPKLAWHLSDLRNTRMGMATKSLFTSIKPDIIHTNNLAGFSTIVWKEANGAAIPVVHTLRDYYLLCPKTTMFRAGHNCRQQCFDCRLLSTLKVTHQPRLNAVVGISNCILDRHAEFGLFKRTRHQVVIPNPVEQTQLPTRCETETGPGKELRIGYLGKVEEFKGIRVLIDALRQWTKTDWRLVVAGQGRKEFVEELGKGFAPGKIEFLGFTPPDALFHQIDVLAVPSLWDEPFGRIVVEAFAAGKPVVASRRGGMTDLVKEGQTGFLFEPDIPETLHQALNGLVNLKALGHDFERQCRQEATRFAPQAIAQRYLDLYNQVLRHG